MSLQDFEKINALLGRGFVATKVGGFRPDDFVLDVGCSYGYFERLYLSRIVRKAIGIDINAGYVFAAQQADSSSRFIVASAEALPFGDSTFTYVVCLDSLEHFANDKRAIEEIRRVLKDNGRLLISVPNKFLDVLDPEFPQHRHYSINDLETLLEGFEIERTYTAGFLIWLFTFWIRRLGTKFIGRICQLLHINEMPYRNLMRWVLDRIAHIDFVINYGWGFSLTVLARKKGTYFPLPSKQG